MPENADKPQDSGTSEEAAKRQPAAPESPPRTKVEVAELQPQGGTQHPAVKELTRNELEALRQQLRRKFHG